MERKPISGLMFGIILGYVPEPWGSCGRDKIEHWTDGVSESSTKRFSCFTIRVLGFIISGLWLKPEGVGRQLVA
jgi:hypothetical protein